MNRERLLEGDPESRSPDPKDASVAWRGSGASSDRESLIPVFDYLLYSVGILPAKKCWRVTYRYAYDTYSVLCALFCCLAMPYALYMHYGVGVSVNGIFGFFMTIVNIQPPLCWFAMFAYMRYSKHHKHVFVPLVRDIYLSQMERTQRTLLFHVKWTFVYSVANIILYIIWLMFGVYPFFPKMSTGFRIIFVVLPVTFIYRLAVPFLSCLTFALLMRAHIRQMLIFQNYHYLTPPLSSRELKPLSWKQGSSGPFFPNSDEFERSFRDKYGASTTGAVSPSVSTSISYLVSLMSFNIAQRNATQKAWSFLFLSTTFIPVLCIVAMAIEAVHDVEELINGWYFIIYAVHFILQAVWIFDCGARISLVSWQIRTTILRDIAAKFVVFQPGECIITVSSYIAYLQTAYRAFNVLGVPITYSLGAKITQVLVFFIGPLFIAAFVLYRSSKGENTA
eukprot:ANDGO_01561.mRNA.1 hypothetical protein